MDYFAGLLLGIDVEEDAQAPGEGAGHVHLVSAEKGHVGPAHLPGGQGGELGVEVAAAGEEDGGYVLDIGPVGFHDGGEEFDGRLKDRLAGVGLDGGGAPDASSQHADIAEALRPWRTGRPASSGQTHRPKSHRHRSGRTTRLRRAKRP